VSLPGGPVFLGGESLYVDAMTLGYVWGERVFAPTCHERVVVDIGAHKGYFGAWALANGAVHVHSVEPSSANYRRLEKAQGAHRRSQSWTTERSAVGDAAGMVSLFVSAESWAHSVQAGMVEAVGVERVEMVTLADVLSRLAEDHPDRDYVLKINVEGSAGSILLAASPSDLQRVMEIHMDHEPGSPYDPEDVFRHLSEAGLDDVEPVSDKIFVIRRRPSV